MNLIIMNLCVKRDEHSYKHKPQNNTDKRQERFALRLALVTNTNKVDSMLAEWIRNISLMALW